MEGRTGLSRRDWVLLALLWLGALGLRLTVLAVPPVIPAIHQDLGLDEKGISTLTALPTLLLAAAAIPGALLIARLGARRALVAGLVGIAGFSALRGVGTAAAVLFPMTVLMGAGVAVSQPAFPTLTRQWFPRRVGLATAVYSNGLLFGEAFPAALTGPLVLPLVHQSWPWSLVFWSAPVAATAALLLVATREDGEPVHPEEMPRRWWPDFRSSQIWMVGLVMGLGSASYFGTNAFTPDFLRVSGRGDLTTPALTALNACQLLASPIVLVFSRRMVGRRLPFLAAAALLMVAFLGALALPGAWFVVCAGLVGLGSALALVLTLALPPLLAAPSDVPRFSAGIFAIMYSCSFIGPLIGGAAWDTTHLPAASLGALAAGACVMAVLAALMRLQPARRQPAVGESGAGLGEGRP